MRVRGISGGWMDAGDTNKYVTFIDDCIHELLSAYETNPAFFKDFKLNIPESKLDAPHFFGKIDDVYRGFISYAWTEPMCAYQSAYIRLLACFAGKPSLPAAPENE